MAGYATNQYHEQLYRENLYRNKFVELPELLRPDPEPWKSFNGSGYSNFMLRGPKWGTLGFIKGGCRIGNSNTTDCTVACQDPKFIFVNPSSVNNCLVYYLLLESNSHKRLSSGNFLEAVKEFNLRVDDSMNGSRIVEILDGCLQQYCRSPFPELGGCGSFAKSNANQLTTALNVTRNWGGLNQLCEGLNQNVNSDIGGAGVFTSYCIHGGLTILLWLVLRILQLLSILQTSPKRGQQSVQVQHLVKQRQKTHIGLSQMISMTKLTLVEFQEAQCFFMLASQAAGLTTWTGGASAIAAASIGQYYNNYLVLWVIATGGILPVTITLYCLCTSGMRSLYILMLSIVTVAVSISSSPLQQRKLDFDSLDSSYLTPPAGSKPLDKCGGNLPPIAFCWSKVEPPTSELASFSQTGTIIFFALLWIAEIILLILRKRYWSAQPERTKQSSIHKLPRAFLVGTGDILLLVCFTVYLRSLLSLLLANAIDLHTWNFGQVVAVSVMAPVISKFVYLMTFGMTGYSEVRIAKPYLIVRAEGNDDALNQGWDENKI